TEINPNAKTLSFEVDIKDKEVIQSLVKDTYQAFGRIDILVNNAGTASRMDLEEMTEEVWDRDIDTNLKGTFYLTQAVIYPYMKEQQYGRIVNISSISGIMGGAVS